MLPENYLAPGEERVQTGGDTFTASHTLALHDADFFETSDLVQQARGAIGSEVDSLGSSLSYTASLVKTKIIAIDYESNSIHSLLTVDGEMWKLKKVETAIAEENPTRYGRLGIIGGVLGHTRPYRSLFAKHKISKKGPASYVQGGPCSIFHHQRQLVINACSRSSRNSSGVFTTIYPL